MPVTPFDSTVTLGLIFLIIAMTYIGVTSRIKLVSVLAVIPCLLLALQFNDGTPPVTTDEILVPLAFVVIGAFNGFYAFFGRD